MAARAPGSTSNQACAACKYQRRKCSPDCPLSPYFPPDQPKRFHNVHKLFGVSNILRILKLVDPAKREDTIKSIVYEADTREKDPVHGCLGVISLLQSQLVKLKDELALVREQLYMLEQQQHSVLLQQHLAQQQAAFAAAAGHGLQQAVYPSALAMSGSGMGMLAIGGGGGGGMGGYRGEPASAYHQQGVALAGGSHSHGQQPPQHYGSAFVLPPQDCSQQQQQRHTTSHGHGQQQQQQQQQVSSSSCSFVPESCASPSLVSSYNNSFVESRPPSFYESRHAQQQQHPSLPQGSFVETRQLQLQDSSNNSNNLGWKLTL